MDVMQRRMELSADVRSVSVDDSLVLADAGRGQYFGLNEVGSLIWKRIEEGFVGHAIAEAIAEEYDVSREAAFEDTRRLLEQFVDMGLVHEQSVKTVTA